MKMTTEAHVKELVKRWFAERGAWSFAPVSNGMGVHGVHDRVGCVPLVVTKEMVGMRFGLFVSVESKRPGRRGEKNRGMTAHQDRNMNEICDAAGISICCDGEDDIKQLDNDIRTLQLGA